MPQAGPLNLITDVAGLRVGNASDFNIKTGCTVLVADAPFTAGVHIMGGAPGTRETDLLAADKTVEQSRCPRAFRRFCLRAGCRLWRC